MYSMNSVEPKARQSKEHLQAKGILFTLRHLEMLNVGDLVDVIVGQQYAKENGYSSIAIITKIEHGHDQQHPFLHLVHTDGRTSQVSAAIVKKLNVWH